MEALYYDPRIQKRVEAIELLNDWGYRIVEITGTLYIVEEFIPAGEDGATVTELVGQNVSKWIHNQTQTTGLTKQAKIQIQQELSVLPLRRRKFSANINWYEYISTSAHNA
jgi:hypothetical protein